MHISTYDFHIYSIGTSNENQADVDTTAENEASAGSASPEKPSGPLEKYIEELKSNLDKSESPSEVSETSPIKKCLNNPQPSTLLTPEKSSEDGDCGPRTNPMFPETSTPKSRSSTPANQNRQTTPGPLSAGSRDLNSESDSGKND